MPVRFASYDTMYWEMTRTVPSEQRSVRVGTRGSELAVRQTEEALGQLEASHSGLRFRVVTIASAGDTHPDLPLEGLGLGAFVKELQVALFKHEIDIAVHSLKDLPTTPTPGLSIAAVTKREDVREALVDKWDLPFGALPQGARIGTGSPRRTTQLRHLRQDLEIIPIRGSVTTRMAKARGQDYDGVVLAMAGLRRLGLGDQATQVFSPEQILPAPGQGALALEVREDDAEVAAIVKGVEEHETSAAVRAERELLKALGGGCRAPFGAYGRIDGNMLVLTGMLGEDSGRELYRATAQVPIHAPQEAAMRVYEALMAQGAAPLLRRTGET